MKMISVNSSAIRAIGYDPDTARLKILFAQGHLYDFCRVPARIFEELMKADSKGSYYNDHIRDRYPC